MSENTESTYPKGNATLHGEAGHAKLDAARLDACAAALDDLHRRMDALGPDNTLTTPGQGREDAEDPKDPVVQAKYHEWPVRWAADAAEQFLQEVKDDIAKGGVGHRGARRAEAELAKARKSFKDLQQVAGSTPAAQQYVKAGEKSVERARVANQQAQQLMREASKKAGERLRAEGWFRDDATAHTDPPESEAQRRAMRAAASGNSTLGIPRSVGKEFSEADPGGELPEKK